MILQVQVALQTAREDNAENGSARSHDAANVNNYSGDHSNRVLIGLVSNLAFIIQGNYFPPIQ